MAQKLIQTQTQQQVQQQRLSQQQMLQVKLLEMPLAELEQNVNAELDDNPALEEKRDDDALDSAASSEDDAYDGSSSDDVSSDGSSSDDDSFEEKSEREEREEALDNALEDLGGDDAMPEPTHGGSQADPDADYEETVWGDTTSFYDKLNEQMGRRSSPISNSRSWSISSGPSMATACCGKVSMISVMSLLSIMALMCR